MCGVVLQCLLPPQVVYNSNPALVPPQKTFVKDSEYAAQFKQYNAMKVASDDLKAIPRAEKSRSKVRFHRICVLDDLFLYSESKYKK